MEHQDEKRTSGLPPYSIGDFGPEYLVECPKCRQRASVVVAEDGSFIRLICTACGHHLEFEAKYRFHILGGRPEEISRGIIIFGSPFDPYFHQPLWLRVSCVGEILWAYNEKHLHFLGDYISANLRERARRSEGDHRNQLLESRLPKWMKAADNREKVLAGIRKLEKKLKG